VSLRWRIAIGFALVALVTAAVIALATPPIVSQGFSDYDNDNDNDAQTTAVSTSGPSANPAAVETDDGDRSAAPAPASTNNPDAEQATILRLILLSLVAAGVASLLGLLGASRLVRPLTTLEGAAAGVARGDLSQRSGLAARSDEFGQLGRTFDSMAGELERAEETRRRFLQDAAHELKTPLAVIEATSSAILDGVYEPERRHVETIRDQSRVLARIVDDLRTISLAEGGHLPLEKRQLDACELLRSVATGFGARAAAGSVEISVQAPDDLRVNADPDRLRQIVGALVDNAIRYVPAAGPCPDRGGGRRPGLSSRLDRPCLRTLLSGRPVTDPRGRHERARALDRSGDRGGARWLRRRGEPGPGWSAHLDRPARGAAPGRG